MVPSVWVEYERLRQPCLDGQIDCELFGLVAGFGFGGDIPPQHQDRSPDGYLKLRRPMFHAAFFTNQAPEGWVDTANTEGFALEFVDPTTGEPDCFFATGKMTQHYKKGGLWVPGTRRADQKPGRNEPCSCGSGLKFKRCCGG